MVSSPDQDQGRLIPVTIIGGYLGSGKTTLVNHLLRNVDGKRLAIMVNEFGDLPIDAELIEAEGDDLISLSGGCVCCSYGSGLIEAFVKLKDLSPRPDQIILEASGVAIPSSISATLTLLEDYHLDAVIGLVDAVHIQSQLSDRYLSDTIARQLEDADLLLLNKVDLVGEELLSNLIDWLTGKVDKTPIVQTRHAEVPLDLLFQPFEHSEVELMPNGSSHLTGLSTEVVVPDVSVSAADYAEKILDEYPNVLRAKGFVQERSGDFKTIQIVGKRIDIYEAPDGVNPGIVIIYQSPSM